MVYYICSAQADFDVNEPLASSFTIKIGLRPRSEGPLAVCIEELRSKFEIRMLSRETAGACVWNVQFPV